MITYEQACEQAYNAKHSVKAALENNARFISVGIGKNYDGFCIVLHGKFTDPLEQFIIDAALGLKINLKYCENANRL